MKVKKFRYFVSDFETTVYKGQVHTEVWASASVELFTEEVNIFHSIEEQFKHFQEMKENVMVYFHNLKFDGEFWMYYLLNTLHYTQAYHTIKDDEKSFEVKWMNERDMPNNSFKYSISDKGQWYSIIIRTNNKFIEIRDSLKLLPFSLKRIGESFDTKHKKLEMDYDGVRYAGCEITELEKEYIRNDVLVIKEALEIMYEQNHKKITIGSCCLEEFKLSIGKDEYKKLFPQLYEQEISAHPYYNLGEYIRKSYRGGWSYVVKGKEQKVFKNGVTADVNSLYPSMMHSMSGNEYPYGEGTYWKGNNIPDKALKPHRYYFIRFKTRFYLKDGYLPFLQIKDNFLYKGNECLETSDILCNDGTHSRYYKDTKGNIVDSTVELVMTMTDFELFKEHYELVDFEIIDGCWFFAMSGIFDNYINKYMEIKCNSKGAVRELAKLFLNNLYGKLASSTDSSFKVARMKDNGVVGYLPVSENDKQAGYIACGSAITSYARNFTIRAAQKNYYGVNKRGFIYADTDSIHCDLDYNELKGVVEHKTEFCCWSFESKWDEAYFTRQKTYIEHIVESDREIVEPYYDIKCAGMGNRCKELLKMSLNGFIIDENVSRETLQAFSEEEQEFLIKERDITCFQKGLKIPSCLKPKRITGGILLYDYEYTMR